MYLLDTNICIFAINKRPPNVIERFREQLATGIFISSLTIAELEYGVENSKGIENNRIALLNFISPFSVLNYDDSDAIRYGKLKSGLRKAGMLIGLIDIAMLLASQALSKDLVLVTNNVAEFFRIEGLAIEDWSSD